MHDSPNVGVGLEQRARAAAAPGIRAWIIGVGALTFLAYAITLPHYQLRVTDLSAWRVSNGAVPYRDFWTMYAPGSFATLGAVFAAFGEQLIISRVLGMLTAAAAVGACFRLAVMFVQPHVALVPTLIFAAAFFGTGYYSGFGSYPVAILAIWLAIARLARAAGGRPQTRDLIVAALCFAVGMVFKHDVVGYALLAGAVSLALTARARTHAERLRPAIILVAAAAAAVSIPVTALLLMGAGSDMVRDLVVFPLTDFRHVRGEYFPLLPRLRVGLIDMAREAIRWTTCNLPTAALLCGLPGVWRRWNQLTPAQRFVLVFLLIAFPLYWMAAHVQINTHAVTLAGIGALVGTAGMGDHRARGRWRVPRVAVIALVVAGWCSLVCLERAYEIAQRVRLGTEPVGLPRLAGITVPPETAKWMRGLAHEMERAAGPEAGLLVLGNRNDVLVFADTTPYWLSSRQPATRYHELHPAITDTAPVQREMLADLGRQPPPVVVREHRFHPPLLDAAKTSFLRHVPVGATLLDEWVEARYHPGPRFGMYEVMRPRTAVRRNESVSGATEVAPERD